MEEIKELIKTACQDLFHISLEPVSEDASVLNDTALHNLQIELTRPDPQFGDYATNIALQLAKPLGQNPRAIAEQIATYIQERAKSATRKIEVAGPGFINIFVNDTVLEEAILHPTAIATQLKGQEIVAEYSDPNPFKVLHAGHLYTSVVGDAIANLLSATGANVHRVNFGGDVGMHVGKTMWAAMQRLGGEHPEKLSKVDPAKRAEWMAECYVEGNNMYDDNEQAKSEMVELNKRVYQLHNKNDHDSAFAQIYWTCRQWSYDYFNAFYARIGSKFERYYPESETAGIGLQTVREHIGKVFTESDGAIVFKGEDYGLHTRVFINSQGIPTYEAKDVGLIMKKWDDYQFDTSIIITGNEQMQYMEVVLKAIAQFAPKLADSTIHLTHGIVKLAGGVKMSSRKGNILRAVDILDVASEANKAATGKDDEQVVLGAVKYAFLKQRIGADIIYDPNESVSIEGNSGPYLQYATVRAKSILRKSMVDSSEPLSGIVFEEDERTLARKITEYPSAVARATSDIMPHHICTYLYELAQSFNRFYEKNRVIDHERELVRIELVKAYAQVLEHGLGLLGITAPEQM